MSKPRVVYFYDEDVGNFHYGKLGRHTRFRFRTHFIQTQQHAADNREFEREVFIVSWPS